MVRSSIILTRLPAIPAAPTAVGRLILFTTTRVWTKMSSTPIRYRCEMRSRRHQMSAPFHCLPALQLLIISSAKGLGRPTALGKFFMTHTIGLPTQKSVPIPLIHGVVTMPVGVWRCMVMPPRLALPMLPLVNSEPLRQAVMHGQSLMVNPLRIWRPSSS